MESGILDFEILKSGIQLKESGIPLTIIRVRHSRSTDNESEIQHLGSGGLHNVESRILICGALTICMENKFRGEFKWNGSYLSRYYLLLVLTFYPFFPFSVPKKNTSTIWRKFFTEISVQIYGKRSRTVGRCKATEGTINQVIVVTTSGYRKDSLLLFLSNSPLIQFS